MTINQAVEFALKLLTVLIFRQTDNIEARQLPAADPQSLPNRRFENDRRSGKDRRRNPPGWLKENFAKEIKKQLWRAFDEKTGIGRFDDISLRGKQGVLIQSITPIVMDLPIRLKNSQEELRIEDVINIINQSIDELNTSENGRETSINVIEKIAINIANEFDLVERRKDNRRNQIDRRNTLNVIPLRPVQVRAA